MELNHSSMIQTDGQFVLLHYLIQLKNKCQCESLEISFSNSLQSQLSTRRFIVPLSLSYRRHTLFNFK